MKFKAFFTEAIGTVPQHILPQHIKIMKELWEYMKSKDQWVYFTPAPSGWTIEFMGQRRSSFTDMYLLLGPMELHFASPHAMTSPYTAGLIRALFKAGPEFHGVKVVINKQVAGTVQSMSAQVKDVVGQYEPYVKEGEGKLKRFGMRVLQELSEIDWYHATLEKYVDSIMRTGLQPSKRHIDQVQDGGSIDISAVKKGWSDFNFNLQQAVYLTSSYPYAQNIAHALTGQFGENAAIIQVSGKALQDYSKLVIDEDAIRHPDMGTVSTNHLHKDMPPFMGSQEELQSVGYKDVIRPEYLKVAEIMEFEGEEEPDFAY